MPLLVCGDILRLNGSLAAGTGLYQGPNNMLTVPVGKGAGCAADPIIIDAAIPNGPMVDAQDTLLPLRLSEVSNIIVRDIRLRKGKFNLAQIGAVGTAQPTTNITLQRIRGYDVLGTISTGFGISVANASNVLVEDSVIVGRFRKNVQVYKTPLNANIVFARNIFLWYFNFTTQNMGQRGHDRVLRQWANSVAQ